MRLYLVFASLLCMALGVNISRAENLQSGSVYDFTFPGIEGGNLPLSNYRGKVILIVNTASHCGYTHQYEGLQTLWQTYRDRGLVVLGVPSNDFGGQEPEKEGKILEFCQGTYGVTFPLTAKQRVSGESAHPFYRWAAKTLGDEAAPRWNFHKYLVAADGRLLAWFSTPTKPLSSDITSAVEAALATANSSPIPAGSGAAEGS